MVSTMVREQFLIINLLCAITISTSAKSIGFVKEFSIDKQDENENANGRLTPSKHTNEETAANYINKIGTKETTKTTQNNNAADSMYTESDLEEADSEELGGPDIKPNEPVKQDDKKKYKNDTELTDVYTESDLEETVSQDNANHELVKRSANTYSNPPTTREDDSFDGSGEGSGDTPKHY